MICHVGQNNLSKLTGGNSGLRPSCMATSVSLLLEYDMKKIPLTQGKFALVDDEDFEELRGYKWHAAKNKYGGFMATRSCICPLVKQIKTIHMHRQIISCPKSKQVDHVNHETLDNRRGNLRECTNQQNAMNRIPYKNNSSRYKGVYKYSEKRWQASIRGNSKKIHLGYFVNELDAAKEYDKAAKELFGEFAFLNFNKGKANE